MKIYSVNLIEILAIKFILNRSLQRHIIEHKQASQREQKNNEDNVIFEHQRHPLIICFTEVRISCYKMEFG